MDEIQPRVEEFAAEHRLHSLHTGRCGAHCQARWEKAEKAKKGEEDVSQTRAGQWRMGSRSKLQDVKKKEKENGARDNFWPS